MLGNRADQTKGVLALSQAWVLESVGRALPVFEAPRSLQKVRSQGEFCPECGGGVLAAHPPVRLLWEARGRAWRSDGGLPAVGDVVQREGGLHALQIQVAAKLQHPDDARLLLGARLQAQARSHGGSGRSLLLHLLFLLAHEGQLVLVAEGTGRGRRGGQHGDLALLQLPGGAAGRAGHLVGLVEARVVHFVVALLLEDHGLKAVAPQDLAGQVGAAGLGGHGRGLHHTLQDDHDLEVLRLQLLLAHAIQWAVLIDLVDNDDGRNQEDAVQADVVAHVEVPLIQRQVLALLGHVGLDELGPHVGLHDVALS